MLFARLGTLSETLCDDLGLKQTTAGKQTSQKLRIHMLKIKCSGILPLHSIEQTWRIIN